MVEMNERDLQLFETIAQVPQATLLKSLAILLRKYYKNNKVQVTGDYILCEGNIPIMLIAHLDTVFSNPPYDIYFDKKKQVLWSPDGLGADDRAGVFSIIKILQKGFRPHICFTCEEEVGGIGAMRMVTQIPKPPFKIKYCIELDRRGASDCVFYHCDNIDFEDYIESFGFITSWGTFTDISEICPAWKVAGVNLSIGYYNEHSISEVLKIKETYATIEKVCEMLRHADTAPEFKYIPAYVNPYIMNMMKDRINKAKNHIPQYVCKKCGKSFNEEDIIPVKGLNTKETYFYCIDCLDENVNWCMACGEPFETTDPDKALCQDCLDRGEI